MHVAAFDEQRADSGHNRTITSGLERTPDKLLQIESCLSAQGSI